MIGGQQAMFSPFASWGDPDGGTNPSSPPPDPLGLSRAPNLARSILVEGGYFMAGMGFRLLLMRRPTRRDESLSIPLWIPLSASYP